jgi:hypothetical protein
VTITRKVSNDLRVANLSLSLKSSSLLQRSLKNLKFFNKHKYFNRVNGNSKAKWSHYRPGQSLRGPGGWGSQISRKSAYESVFRLRTGNHYIQRNIPCTHFCYRLSRSQGHCAAGRICQWIIPMTPATFRLVAQCLNQMRHHVPCILIGCKTIYLFTATHKLNPDSNAKSRWSWLSESQYLLVSIPNLVHNVSSITFYHYAHLQHEKFSDCWLGLSVVKNPSLFKPYFCK